MSMGWCSTAKVRSTTQQPPHGAPRWRGQKHDCELPMPLERWQRFPEARRAPDQSRRKMKQEQDRIEAAPRRARMASCAIAVCLAHARRPQAALPAAK